MNPAEFQMLVHAEKEMWWYRGMQRILFRVLDRMKPSAPGCYVLEAGCGAGCFAGLATGQLLILAGEKQ